jgi:DNA-binding MarR family transcriptional regulator
MSVEPHPFTGAVVDAHDALAALTTRSVSSVNASLTPAQYRTLVAVANEGPQCVGALAESLDVHASTMTRMCDRLSARELITRTSSTKDHRTVTIALTPNGRVLVDEITRVQALHVVQAAECVDPTDLTVALRVLQSFATALRRTKTPNF